MLCNYFYIYTINWGIYSLRLQFILCLLPNFIVTRIPFCCGEFSGLDLHYGSFWILLKALGIFFCRGVGGCLEYTPPPRLYQTVYVLLHPIVEKLESIWKSMIVLYFLNPLLCVWIFNNNVASRVCYNNMKLALKFSFSLEWSFFVSVKTLLWKYHATPTPLEQSVSLRCDFFSIFRMNMKIKRIVEEDLRESFF